MGILLLNFLRKNPVEADLTGVVRQVQQGPGSLQIPAELLEALPAGVHVFEFIEHTVQLFEADFALQCGKVNIIAQNGHLQTCKQGIGGFFHTLANGVHPFQHEAVGHLLFLGEAVGGEVIVLMQEHVDLVGEPGGGHILRGLAVHFHQVTGKIQGLIVAQFPGDLHLTAHLAHQAFSIKFDHTASFTTILTKSLGTSR